MKKEKLYELILIVVAILILIAVILFFCFREDSLENINNDSSVDEMVEENEYVDEEKNNYYSYRMKEADSKDYVTLFLESNIFDGQHEITIKYNNEKFVLNTANPLLDNVEISKLGKTSSFNISLEQLQNYSIIFLKKNVSQKINPEDIILER